MNSKNSQINLAKENLSATLQALVADDSLQIEFDENLQNNFFSWDQNLVVGEKKIAIPQIELAALNKEDVVQSDGGFFNFRAASDLAACYLLFHDEEIHKDVMLSLSKHDYWSLVPQDMLRQAQHDINEFEKARVLAKVKNIYLGAAKNILLKLENDVEQFLCEGIDPVMRRGDSLMKGEGFGLSSVGKLIDRSVTPSHDGVGLSKIISLIFLHQFFPQEILPNTKNVALELEKNLNKKIVAEIKNLTKKIDSQSDFAQAVNGILQMMKDEEESQKKDEEKPEKEAPKKSKNDLENFGSENIEQQEEQNFSSKEEDESQQKIEEKPQEIFDLKDDEQEGEVSVKLDSEAFKQDGIEFKNAYKIFTNKFDEVIFPQKLVAKNELQHLRDQLDLKMGKLMGISKKMSLKLKRKLLSKQNSFLETDASRGILDRKKLTRLVIDPLCEDIWVNNKTHEYQNTALTILLDNSGSMRGNPIVMSALACEIIAGILEKFCVKTEIIGFTTSDWKGGRAKKLWESSGRPKNPGRLNELRHIVYKHFNQKFKPAKINLGLMLKEGILKENIDGEALLFARSRLMQQSEKRKILLVISDGTPVDDSTNSANDSDILSEHLSHVINKIEKQSKIEIVGIGIGHSTEEFYRNSIAIKSLEELGDVMIEKIAQLL